MSCDLAMKYAARGQMKEHYVTVLHKSASKRAKRDSKPPASELINQLWSVSKAFLLFVGTVSREMMRVARRDPVIS